MGSPWPSENPKGIGRREHQTLYLAAEVFPFRQRVRWFQQCLKALIRETGIIAAMEQRRPKSEVVQAYLPSISLPWDARALNEVEIWLANNLASPCVRDAGALKSLPLAAQKVSMRV